MASASFRKNSSKKIALPSGRAAAVDTTGNCRCGAGETKRSAPQVVTGCLNMGCPK